MPTWIVLEGFKRWGLTLPNCPREVHKCRALGLCAGPAKLVNCTTWIYKCRDLGCKTRKLREVHTIRGLGLPAESHIPAMCWKTKPKRNPISSNSIDNIVLPQYSSPRCPPPSWCPHPPTPIPSTKGEKKKKRSPLVRLGGVHLVFASSHIYPVADAYSATVLLPFNAPGVLLDRHVDVECQTGCITLPPLPHPLPPSSRGKNCASKFNSCVSLHRHW